MIEEHEMRYYRKETGSNHPAWWREGQEGEEREKMIRDP